MDEKQMAQLGVQLTEVAVRNMADSIYAKIKTSKAKKKDTETIQQLEEIISSLIADKNELVQIAQSYEQRLVAQQISKKDIEYITTEFIPVIKELIQQTSGSNDNVKNSIDKLAPLLSVETLTVLQLLGFNYKQAIGEPLTLLIRSAIMSKVSANTNNIAQ